MKAKAIAIAVEDRPRVWSTKQIFLGTAFGGYLCGFYLVSQNYQALGYPQLAKKANLCAIFSSLILLVSFLAMTEDSVEKFALFMFFAQGIVVTGYLCYEHYKSLFKLNYLIQALIFLPLFTFFLLAIPFYLPEYLLNTIPSTMIPFITAAIVSGFSQAYQEVHIKLLIEGGTKNNSFKKLLGITLLSVIIQLGVAYAIALVAEVIFPNL